MSSLKAICDPCTISVETERRRLDGTELEPVYRPRNGESSLSVSANKVVSTIASCTSTLEVTSARVRPFKLTERLNATCRPAVTGDKDGVAVLGATVGVRDGVNDGLAVGAADGDLVGSRVGWNVGNAVGFQVGCAVGARVGMYEGCAVGFRVGSAEGSLVGEKVGLLVGRALGSTVGLRDGAQVGVTEG